MIDNILNHADLLLRGFKIVRPALSNPTTISLHDWLERYNYTPYIECAVCGERYYLNEDNQPQVNGEVIQTCIYCEHKKQQEGI